MKFNFIHKNDGFTCTKCKKEVAKQIKSCRNHCPHCLYSLHVDFKTPGDRNNPCKGLMFPKYASYNSKKGYIITHECQKCHTLVNNKAAPDDDLNTLILLTQTANEPKTNKHYRPKFRKI